MEVEQGWLLPRGDLIAGSESAQTPHSQQGSLVIPFDFDFFFNSSTGLIQRPPLAPYA